MLIKECPKNSDKDKNGHNLEKSYRSINRITPKTVQRWLEKRRNVVIIGNRITDSPAERDPYLILLATHQGLFLLENKELTQVGPTVGPTVGDANGERARPQLGRAPNSTKIRIWRLLVCPYSIEVKKNNYYSSYGKFLFTDPKKSP